MMLSSLTQRSLVQQARALSLSTRRTILVLCLLLLPPSFSVAQNMVADGQYRALIGDNKAFRVGDALTVQIMENSSANSSVDLSGRRSQDINATVSKHDGSRKGPAGIGTNNDFEGSARTQRANRVLATVSVLVQEVLPNGDLRIAGMQSVTVNNELQRVTVSGRVRPVDINEANSVNSSRLAEAKIDFVGDGDLTNHSRRGLLTRFFSWMGI